MVLVFSRGLRLLALALVMGPEGFHDRRGEVYAPVLAALGFLSNPPGVSPGYGTPDLSIPPPRSTSATSIPPLDVFPGETLALTTALVLYSGVFGWGS